MLCLFLQVSLSLLSYYFSQQAAGKSLLLIIFENCSSGEPCYLNLLPQWPSLLTSKMVPTQQSCKQKLRSCLKEDS